MLTTNLTAFLKVSSFMFCSKNMEDYSLLLYASYLLLDILTFPKDLLSLICQTNLVISSPLKTTHKTHVSFPGGLVHSWLQESCVAPVNQIGTGHLSQVHKMPQAVSAWTVGGLWVEHMGLTFSLADQSTVILKIRQREVSQHLLVWPPQLSGKKARVHNKCIPVWRHIPLSSQFNNHLLTIGHLYD